MPTQFGHKIPGQEYQSRPSVYGVIVDDSGRLAAVVDDTKIILPGGGVDSGENPAEALVREIREETGWLARIGSRIGEAHEYIFAPRQKQFVNKLGHFYFAHITGSPLESVTPEHDVVWIKPDEFTEQTNHESHAWAVRAAMKELGKHP